ncbi:hypothetical protein [Methylobrevis pamukkalensis]|uniref:Uncharacterized protein n=1 Tax=Methylobrevis pamukkalensis TaxID=1439726 RepID=A0A1E3GZZ6_9HYPH|nr:hypothetical protein [Methylobrevis pamukkalensis]ODN69658.1 hypothetical protein A6302_03036 [Methylobrevis pamukkalensis]
MSPYLLLPLSFLAVFLLAYQFAWNAWNRTGRSTHDGSDGMDGGDCDGGD